MQSLLQVATTYKNKFASGDLKKSLDLKNLDDATLLRISDPSGLSCEEFADVLMIDSDRDQIRLLQNMISFVTLEDFKMIEFEKFSDIVHRSLLGYMLVNDYAIALLCVLLDKMKSVNYGDISNPIHKSYELHIINPLIYCCRKGDFYLVKVLVERYNADLEHLSWLKKTAIMYSVEYDHVEITKYLYDRGSRLETKECHINKYASSKINKLIIEWQAETQRCIDEREEMIEMKLSDYNEMKANYEKLQAENQQMKSTYETILNLVENAKTRLI